MQCEINENHRFSAAFIIIIIIIIPSDIQNPSTR